MSLYPCSACHERAPGKLSQVYWAWNRADGTRRAIRQRLCLNCFLVHVWPAALEAQQSLISCPMCHVGTIDDMDPVYATIYMPGHPRTDAEMALCGPCAVEMRNHAETGAEPLPERQGGDGGPQPPTMTPAQAWDSLGLQHLPDISQAPLP